MDFKFFLILVFGSILMCLYDIFITNRISEKEAKKCGYNCEKCGNWRCFYHYCTKKREEL
ncbi:MAG: hypothetical protein HFJ26_01135 [Clostridia bacterium]|nr:hypothetical protein [Clostridia bacterium]